MTTNKQTVYLITSNITKIVVRKCIFTNQKYEKMYDNYSNSQYFERGLNVTDNVKNDYCTLKELDNMHSHILHS
jgi:hypothetical protein